MAYLRKVSTGAITERLDDSSEVYQRLVQQRAANGSAVWESAVEEDTVSVLARVAVGLVDPLGALVDDTQQLDAGPLGEGGTITSAEYTPSGAQAGAATNTRTITVNAGATVHATLALVAGVNLVSGTPSSMTINAAAVTAGEELVVTSAHAGTGIPDPGGIVTVEVTYTA